jgi:hypothetical protein
MTEVQISDSETELWCDGCNSSDAEECADNNCKNRVRVSDAPMDDDDWIYCHDCVEAHRSTRERLRRDYECFTRAFDRRAYYRNLNYYPPHGKELVVIATTRATTRATH